MLKHTGETMFMCYMYIYLTSLQWQDVTQGQFVSGVKWFEFRVFLHLD